MPPGQIATDEFPVVALGVPPAPVPLRAWELVVTDGEHSLTLAWGSLTALGVEDRVVDLHCVQRWSHQGSHWSGVPVATVISHAGVELRDFATVSSYGGYATTLETADLMNPSSLIATGFRSRPIPHRRGGPVRLLVPHRYLWKSPKWLREIRLTDDWVPGWHERRGRHRRGDPWREERWSSTKAPA